VANQQSAESKYGHIKDYGRRDGVLPHQDVGHQWRDGHVRAFLHFL
jgi:hypothetical protein